jgi:hypothetical protein
LFAKANKRSSNSVKYADYSGPQLLRGPAYITRDPVIMFQEIEQLLSIAMALRPYPDDRSEAVYSAAP